MSVLTTGNSLRDLRACSRTKRSILCYTRLGWWVRHQIRAQLKLARRERRPAAFHAAFRVTWPHPPGKQGQDRALRGEKKKPRHLKGQAYVTDWLVSNDWTSDLARYPGAERADCQRAVWLRSFRGSPPTEAPGFLFKNVLLNLATPKEKKKTWNVSSCERIS